MKHAVVVTGVPAWVDADRLLGPGPWAAIGPEAESSEADPRERSSFAAQMETLAAADLSARLRGIALGGSPLSVAVTPLLNRNAVRDARTEDARRRRQTTAGFSRPGVQLDEEGRWSLTPEALAMEMARGSTGKTVVDAGCGAGGNAIAFARAGARVTAIERDPGRLALARHNAHLYGVAEKIRFLQGDAEAIVPTLHGDLLFLDPPWGEAWSRSLTVASEMPLLGLFSTERFSSAWAKVPPSFDPGSLHVPIVTEAIFGVERGDFRRVKFLLVRRR